MKYAVDMQGFKQPVDDFIIKELAIVPIESNSNPIIYLFKSPFAFNVLDKKYQKENRWLEYCYHGIPWTSGTISYDQVGFILREVMSDATTVFVKVNSHKKWLERFKFNVYNITEMGYPALDRVPANILMKVCSNHKNAYKAMCALHNVKLIKKFYLDNSTSLERSMKIFAQTYHLSFMRPEDIAQLGKDFIVKYAANSVESAWEKLPESWKEDPEIIECRWCTIHNDLTKLKRDCSECMYLKYCQF